MVRKNLAAVVRRCWQLEQRRAQSGLSPDSRAACFVFLGPPVRLSATPHATAAARPLACLPGHMLPVVAPNCLHIPAPVGNAAPVFLPTAAAAFALVAAAAAVAAASRVHQNLCLCSLCVQGVGKGTYSTRIADYFGMEHIASGDLVRDEMRKGTDIGKEVSE